jgi:GntR family transcriptional regulator
MFINAGARAMLLEGERQKFLSEEWPRISAMIQRLGLNTKELLEGKNGQPAVKAESARPAQNSSEEEES